MPFKISLATCVICALFLILDPVFAQAGSDDRMPEEPAVLPQLPIDLQPPGARAMGMGGAFLAVADDATAAEANPAGLVILTKPEISLHGRSKSFDLEIDDPAAHFALDLANSFSLQTDIRPETVPRLSAETIQTVRESLTSGSFSSIVWPFDRWVLSFYYAQPVDFEARTDFSLFDEALVDLYTTRQGFDLEQQTLGLSVATKLGKNVSFGLSLRSSELRVSSVQSFRAEYFADLEFLTNNLDHIDFFQFSDLADGSDTDFTFNAGILFYPNGKFSVGLVYKEGGVYEIDGVQETFDCVDFAPRGLTCDPESREGNSVFFESSPFSRRFELPDFVGLGLAWRPTDRLLLALDLDHVGYSSLAPSRQAIADSAGVLEEVEDVLEVHFGLEYTLLLGAGKTPLTLRTGAFTEQDHDGYALVDSEQVHVTFGLGSVIAGKLQIDLAGHWSETLDEVLLSTVYHF